MKTLVIGLQGIEDKEIIVKSVFPHASRINFRTRIDKDSQLETNDLVVRFEQEEKNIFSVYSIKDRFYGFRGFYQKYEHNFAR